MSQSTPNVSFSCVADSFELIAVRYSNNEVRYFDRCLHVSCNRAIDTHFKRSQDPPTAAESNINQGKTNSLRDVAVVFIC